MESLRMWFTLQNSGVFDPQAPIATVAHDAGGANQIIAFFKAHGGVTNVRACMAGPARQLWLNAFPKNNLFGSVKDVLAGSCLLLAGTGWASDFEHKALIDARRVGVPSASLLDHWVNYGQRFIRDGQTVLPDELWVVDEYAFSIAQQIFPRHSIKRIADYYLAASVQQVSDPVPSRPNLLYILEPVRSNWGRAELGEFQALDYFIQKLPRLSLPEGTRIRLRPHPAEDDNKYQSWVDQHADVGVSIDASSTLVDALSVSQWVAGCESYALVVALAAGRTVYSTLPPWAPECRLPHSGVIQIKSL